MRLRSAGQDHRAVVRNTTLHQHEVLVRDQVGQRGQGRLELVALRTSGKVTKGSVKRIGHACSAFHWRRAMYNAIATASLAMKRSSRSRRTISYSSSPT